MGETKASGIDLLLDMVAAQAELEEKRKRTQSEKGANGRKVSDVGTVVYKVAQKSPAAGYEASDVQETSGPMPITDKDKAIIRKQLGIVRLDDIKTDHLNPKDKALMQSVIRAAGNYMKMVELGWFFLMVAGPQFILTNGTTIPDPVRTGYGCGKTMIAKAISHKFSSVDMVPEIGLESINVHNESKFFTAATLMASWLDGDDFSVGRLIPNRCPLVVIDEVGREGNLKYISADSQSSEIQARYFQVVNHCYERGIPMVFTSNLRGPELSAVLGGATWSRIQEKSPPGHRKDLTGIPDYRLFLGGHMAGS